MGVVNTKSTVVYDRDNRILPPGHLAGCPLMETVGTVEVAAGDDDGSIFRMVRVRSNWRLSEILVANDALTDGTDYDVGLYRTAADGGAVVSKDLFADGVTMASALAYRDLTNNDQAADIAEVEKRVYERLGLTEDPQLEYDVCITANTVGSAAGTLSMKVRFAAS